MSEASREQSKRRTKSPNKKASEEDHKKTLGVGISLCLLTKPKYEIVIHMATQRGILQRRSQKNI